MLQLLSVSVGLVVMYYTLSFTFTLVANLWICACLALLCSTSYGDCCSCTGDTWFLPGVRDNVTNLTVSLYSGESNFLGTVLVFLPAGNRLALISYISSHMLTDS